MLEILLNVLLAALILGLSAVLTQWFSRRMYITCGACGTLNARRRTHCRRCGGALGRV